MNDETVPVLAAQRADHMSEGPSDALARERVLDLPNVQSAGQTLGADEAEVAGVVPSPRGRAPQTEEKDLARGGTKGDPPSSRTASKGEGFPDGH
jgi:hypothetical protein